MPTAEQYRAKKLAGRCAWCSDRTARGSVYCREHAKNHRDYQRQAMREKRAADPAYRELERLAVRERMRRLRARADYQRPD